MPPESNQSGRILAPGCEARSNRNSPHIPRLPLSRSSRPLQRAKSRLFHCSEAFQTYFGDGSATGCAGVARAPAGTAASSVASRRIESVGRDGFIGPVSTMAPLQKCGVISYSDSSIDKLESCFSEARYRSHQQVGFLLHQARAWSGVILLKDLS
jgi:hypothetical protein